MPANRSPAAGRPRVLFLAATALLEVLLVVAILAPLVQANHVIQEHQQQQQQPPPAIISWDAYRQLFNKQYSSIGQQLIRQKIFIAKTMQVFMSAVKYRLNQASCYLAINKFSDLNQDEASRILAGDSAGGAAAAGHQHPGRDHDDHDDDDFMDDERVRQLLEQEDSDDEDEDDDDESDGGEGGGASRARKSQRGGNKKSKRTRKRPAPPASVRAKREATHVNGGPKLVRQLSFKDLVRVPTGGGGGGGTSAAQGGGGGGAGEDQPQLKYRWFVPPSNPDYEPMEQASMAPGGGGGAAAAPWPRQQKPRLADIPASQVGQIEQEAKRSQHRLQSIIGKASSWSGQAASNVLHSAFKWFTSSPTRATDLALASDQQAASSASEEAIAASAKADQDHEHDRDRDLQLEASPLAGSNQTAGDLVRIDWRQSGCIGPPIDQGACNSCYAISTMSFVEWKLCMVQQRQLTPLSPQYMVSCGVQLKRETRGRADFNGCDRGYSKHSAMFIENYGVELEANMPYLATMTDCPVAPDTPLKRKGYIRPNVKDTVRMLPSTSQLDLALRKGPVIVSLLEPMNFLDYGGGMVDNCYQRGGHAMLIVGSGVENGVEYLLIKNSFGTSWGMNGYFKFKRAAVRRCVKQFIFVKLSFPGKKAQARRVKAYLAEQEAQDYAWNEQELPNVNIEQYFDVGAGGLFSSSSSSSR